jgi:ribosomal protein S18 acetylase RimI-like enzyme
MTPETLALLLKDPLRNIAMLGFFSNYPAEMELRQGDSILLLGRSDHLWAYISCNNAEDLAGLLEKCPAGTKFFASIEDWMKPVIAKDTGIEWELATLRYYLPDDQPVRIAKAEIIRLDVSYVSYIFNHSHYKFYTSEEYIRARMEKGVSSGIVTDGKLAAWALTHDDGSLGFLHVLPEFRNRGYAGEVLADLISKKRNEKKPVFANIEPGNTAAINLVRKIGFIVDRKTSWIKLK